MRDSLSMQKDITEIKISIARIEENLKSRASLGEANAKAISDLDSRVVAVEKYQWKHAGLGGLSGAGVAGFIQFLIYAFSG